MDEDAHEAFADIAASGADAQHGEHLRAEHVDPVLLSIDADGGLVEMFDGDECAAKQLGDLLDEGAEAVGGAPGHGGDRGCRGPDPEPVTHELAEPLFENELRVKQIGH